MLQDRCFGTAMTFSIPDGLVQQWTSGQALVENAGIHPIAHYILWIVAGSNAGGFENWRNDVLARLKKAQEMGDGFITSHEEWWKKFWDRSSLVFPGDDGSHLRHQAAFEFYRYYTACAADIRREVPIPMFVDLYRYNEQPYFWNSRQAIALQTFQAWYAASKVGNGPEMASELSHRLKMLPAMKKWVENNSNYHGCAHPYYEDLAGPYLGKKEISATFKDTYNFNGNLYWLTLQCDYLSLAGEDQKIEKGLLTWATGLLTFIFERFPNRTDKGQIDFTPSNCQEAYWEATDGVELLVGLHLLLPRLLSMGAKRGWDRELLKSWRQIYKLLPELPRGQIVLNENDVKQWAELEKAGWPSYSVAYAPRRLNESDKVKFPIKRWPENLFFSPLPVIRMTLEPGDILAPVCKLNHDKTRFTSNESPELLSIWPGKLMLRNKADREVALKSYYQRLFKNVPTGWQLDLAHSASLGLRDEVKTWWPYHFDTIFTFPCGLGQDLFGYMPDRPSITHGPTLEGTGTGVIPLLEMLFQDYPDLMIILPCWEPEVAVQ
jgi:hypothetical protein